MARSRGRKRGLDDHEEHFDEGWLVSYADMMTLLVALFMVLFSISSVNISKFESLQRSLQAAFSGKIFPGGEALQQTGGDDHSTENGSTQAPPTFAPTQRREGSSAAARKKEEQELEKLRKKIDAAARDLGLSHKVKTSVTKDGLRVRVLTDDLLFASGQAIPSPASLPLLARLGQILDSEGKHPIVIEGHTDSVPTAGTRFATNWELSTERATSIVKAFATTGVVQRRMTAAGRAYLDPVAGNDTSTGRSLNRRVEILLPRMARTP
jgi:chemotaxis protein MotB